MVGFSGIMQGIVSLVNNELYVVTPKWVIQFGTTTWGWIEVGIIALGAGSA